MIKPKSIVKQTAISQELASFVLAENKKFIQNLPTDEVIILIKQGITEGTLKLTDSENSILNQIG
jgi:hypothetical protein